MKKFSKILISALLAATMIFGVVGLSACNIENDDPILHRVSVSGGYVSHIDGTETANKYRHSRFEEGTIITVAVDFSAVPTDTLFMSWSKNGQIVSSDKSFTFTIENFDVDIVANFNAHQFTEDPSFLRDFDAGIAGDCFGLSTRLRIDTLGELADFMDGFEHPEPYLKDMLSSMLNNNRSIILFPANSSTTVERVRDNGTIYGRMRYHMCAGYCDEENQCCVEDPPYPTTHFVSIPNDFRPSGWRTIMRTYNSACSPLSVKALDVVVNNHMNMTADWNLLGRLSYGGGYLMRVSFLTNTQGGEVRGVNVRREADIVFIEVQYRSGENDALGSASTVISVSEAFVDGINKINVSIVPAPNIAYVVYEASIEGGANPSPADMEATRARLANLLLISGFTQATVRVEGGTRIRVEAPDVNDVSQLLNIIGNPMQIEFRDHKGNVILTGKNVLTAAAAFDSSSGGYIVSLTFDEQGTAAFKQATAPDNHGQQISIVSIIGAQEQVISSPQINAQITTGVAMISGMPDQQTAQNLATQIISGQLPVQLTLLQSGIR